MNEGMLFVAGFFEGSGSVSVNKKQKTVKIGFFNKDKNLLYKIRDILAIKNDVLTKPKPKGGKTFQLFVTGRENVYKFICDLLSIEWVTAKRGELGYAKEYMERENQV